MSSLAIQAKVRLYDHYQDEGGLKKGAQAPDFTLQTVDGKSVTLSHYRGEPVIIDFFATWCGPCKREMLTLKAWHNNKVKKGKKPISVLAISVDRDGDDLYHYVKNHANPFTILHDPTKSVATQYNVKGLPTLYLIDREGKISLVQVGLSPGLTFMLDKFIDPKHYAEWSLP